MTPSGLYLKGCTNKTYLIPNVVCMPHISPSYNECPFDAEVCPFPIDWNNYQERNIGMCSFESKAIMKTAKVLVIAGRVAYTPSHPPWLSKNVILAQLKELIQVLDQKIPK